METGKPFEMDEDGRKIWFPKWQANIDDDVNAAFIQEVITIKHQDLRDKNGKGEIPDSTYENKQYKELNDAELGLKALARKT